MRKATLPLRMTACLARAARVAIADEKKPAPDGRPGENEWIGVQRGVGAPASESVSLASPIISAINSTNSSSGS